MPNDRHTPDRSWTRQGVLYRHSRKRRPPSWQSRCSKHRTTATPDRPSSSSPQPSSGGLHKFHPVPDDPLLGRVPPHTDESFLWPDALPPEQVAAAGESELVVPFLRSMPHRTTSGQPDSAARRTSRALFDAFRLEVRYDRVANVAHCQVTVRADTQLDPVTFCVVPPVGVEPTLRYF